jgi:hypothetical protein
MWLVLGPWACGQSYNPAREAIDQAKQAEVQGRVCPGAAWGCPMHPEVQAAQAGDCPVCRMPLVKGGS